MNALTRSWHGSSVVVMLVALLGLLVGNALCQEHEHARPIVVKDKAAHDNPFESPEGREREGREHPEARGREHGERPTERDVLRRQVEVLKIAQHGLLEAEKKDAADVLQRAIRAREVTLERRGDDEAHMIRERAPNREQLVEILKTAAGAWREFNKQDKAEVVGELAREFAGQRERERERPARERRELVERERHQVKRAATEPQVREEIEHLKGAVHELSGQLNQMRHQMEEMQRLLKSLADRKREER